MDRLPCEVIARSVLPALRALIARKLVRDHGFTQANVAGFLGVTQATISHYLANKRGKLTVDICEPEELELVANEIAVKIAHGNLDPDGLRKEICKFCLKLKKKQGLP
ncbi:MAG TPA: hypothetical protein ENF34_02155 [Candidatus Bathyarchaeota archaeon]|nr:hypothetical protein [Candidatus Bathyarchaeota archaeon]